MTDVLTICGAGIFTAFAITILREIRREYTPVLLLAVCIVFSLCILPKISESVRFIRELSDYLEDTHADTLFRALGITYLTATASDICKSAGEASVAGYIELAGRAELMVLCLPLFREILALALF